MERGVRRFADKIFSVLHTVFVRFDTIVSLCAAAQSVGLSMMRYTEGKASSACFGERQLRGLIGKLLY